MSQQINRTILSGCSGGGKTTLLDTLAFMGYSTVAEAGRTIVQEQMRTGMDMTPWENPATFCELAVEASILAFKSVETLAGPTFFDRSLLDIVSFYQTLNVVNPNRFNALLLQYRYAQTVYFTPPWPEIYVQDAERKHTFEDAVREYERLLAFYPAHGYDVVILPKVSIEERIKFIIF